MNSPPPHLQLQGASRVIGGLIDHKININCTSDAKYHIYTLEDQMWDLKGQFDVPEKEDEEMNWSRMENGEHVAHLLAVSYKLN